MSLAILRRLRTPAAIETAPAPPLTVGHVDIIPPARHGDPPVVVDAEEVTEAVDFEPETMIPPAAFIRVEHRDPVDRGTCYHQAHVHVPQRGRVGLLVDGDNATLLSCRYSNAEGY